MKHLLGLNKADISNVFQKAMPPRESFGQTLRIFLKILCWSKVVSDILEKTVAGRTAAESPVPECPVGEIMVAECPVS